MKQISKSVHGIYGPKQEGEEYVFVFHTCPKSNLINSEMIRDLIIVEYGKVPDTNPDGGFGFGKALFSGKSALADGLYLTDEIIIMTEGNEWKIGKILDQSFKPMDGEFERWVLATAKSELADLIY